MESIPYTSFPHRHHPGALLCGRYAPEHWRLGTVTLRKREKKRRKEEEKEGRKEGRKEGGEEGRKGGRNGEKKRKTN